MSKSYYEAPRVEEIILQPEAGMMAKNSYNQTLMNLNFANWLGDTGTADAPEGGITVEEW